MGILSSRPQRDLSKISKRVNKIRNIIEKHGIALTEKDIIHFRDDLLELSQAATALKAFISRIDLEDIQFKIALALQYSEIWYNNSNFTKIKGKFPKIYIEVGIDIVSEYQPREQIYQQDGCDVTFKGIENKIEEIITRACIANNQHNVDLLKVYQQGIDCFLKVSADKCSVVNNGQEYLCNRILSCFDNQFGKTIQELEVMKEAIALAIASDVEDIKLNLTEISNMLQNLKFNDNSNLSMLREIEQRMLYIQSVAENLQKPLLTQLKEIRENFRFVKTLDNSNGNLQINENISPQEKQICLQNHWNVFETLRLGESSPRSFILKCNISSVRDAGILKSENKNVLDIYRKPISRHEGENEENNAESSNQEPNKQYLADRQKEYKEEFEDIKNTFYGLKSDTETFIGKESDNKYFELDEMCTRLVLRLDKLHFLRDSSDHMKKLDLLKEICKFGDTLNVLATG